MPHSYQVNIQKSAPMGASKVTVASGEWHPGAPPSLLGEAVPESVIKAFDDITPGNSESGRHQIQVGNAFYYINWSN
jgi:hypothetical protein